jgi:hypothetical protein
MTYILKKFRQRENMRQSTRITLIVSVLFLIVCFCLCSIAPTAGNSSQTGNNGITVIASAGQIYGKSRNSLKASAYDINFQPQNHMQGFSDSVSSDDSGRFIFGGLPEGVYNLKIQDTLSSECAFISNIPVFKDSFFIDTSTKLAAPGFISGVFLDSTGQGFPLSYVLIKGSPFYTVTGNEGKFLLGPVPHGKYLLKFQINFKNDITGALVPTTSMTLGTDSITVMPDSTIKVYLKSGNQ